MNSNVDSAPDVLTTPARHMTAWLNSGVGRFVLLGLAIILSMPASFSGFSDIGLDPSWALALQLAAIKGKIFGKDFVLTYGPLGYLAIHTAVNKSVLLLYDLFTLGSLLAIYNALLPARLVFSDALGLGLLAIVTKTCWLMNPAAMQFLILCFWLSRSAEGTGKLAAAAALGSATILFFGKVNYGLILILLLPAFGLGLLAVLPKRRFAGIFLLAGFPVLVWLGARIWSVDLPGYLRAGLEIIAGYNEAMFAYSDCDLLVFELACVFLTAIGLVALAGFKRICWREQLLFLPLILLAALLLFKNAFARSDELHQNSFFAALPLLLAVWYIGWRRAPAVKMMLLGSLFYPLALLAIQTKTFGLAEFAAATPLRYFHEVSIVPQRASAEYFQACLQLRYPQAALPANIRATIGQATVDVMPWDLSIAVLNGLNYQPRPVPQSYAVYRSWLDRLNASFLDSTNAPDFVLFACAQMATIDGRPAAWDESLTKLKLLENYTFAAEFQLPMRVLPNQNLENGPVFLLKHTPHARRFVAVSTNEITLALGQPIPLPATTNYLFLTLDVKRTLAGKLASAVLWPEMLLACFQYQDGSPGVYRAILPILQAGVLINRRVETPDETRRWLQLAGAQNLAATSLDFKTHNSAAFQTPLHGQLVAYRLEENPAAQHH